MINLDTNLKISSENLVWRLFKDARNQKIQERTSWFAINISIICKKNETERELRVASRSDYFAGRPVEAALKPPSQQEPFPLVYLSHF